MNIHLNSAAACLLLAAALTSCDKTDNEAPTVCTQAGAMNSVLADEVEAEAGDHIDLEDLFCDNEGLSQVRWDIHNGQGHAHEDDEGHEHGLTLHSGTDWAVLETANLEGTEAEAELHVDVPLTARGIWHLIVNVVDAAGNTAAYNTDLHIENSHIPEFDLTTVNGESPDSWHGEPTWAAGSTVEIVGTVADSDGILSAELELIDEATEGKIWFMDIDASDSTDGTPVTFTAQVPVPSNAGEYYFEMKATCNANASMETGFHVEVE